MSGFVAGVLSTVIGGVVIIYVTNFLTKKPKLSWFVASSTRISNAASFFQPLESLRWKELPGVKFEGDSSIIKEVSRAINLVRERVTIVIRNDGGIAASGVNIVLSNFQGDFEVEPKMHAELTDLGEKGATIRLEGIDARSQAKIHLFGISKSDIERVSHDGAKVNFIYSGDLMIDPGCALVPRSTFIQVNFIWIFAVLSVIVWSKEISTYLEEMNSGKKVVSEATQ